jgi:parallel beta-helix repeat protein
MRCLAPVLSLLILALAGDAARGVNLYVASTGNDASPGTAARPFATLQRARDEIRHLKAAGPLPEGGVTVEVQGGVYRLWQPLELTAADSGQPKAPIVYRARPGEIVKIVGGQTVVGWKRVDDPSVLKRIDPSARGRLWVADLKAAGIKNLEGIDADPGLEVFYNDKPMTLARYPNQGYLRIADVLDAKGVVCSGEARTREGRFICNDDRIKRWSREPEVWLHGFWMYDWADERIRLANIDAAGHVLALAPPASGERAIRKGQWFYVENVFSELNSPGEWFLDRARGLLYFWPPEPFEASKVVVSVVHDLLRMTGVSNVVFRGLLWEAGRGTAITVAGGSNVKIVACTVRNMGRWAIRVAGGAEHGVVGCDVYQTGQGGIYLEGGNRQTLVAGGHYAENNHIHHTARWDPVYQQAIALYGVGNRATHNLIDHVPHVAIGFSGNDQTIEYNEIHSSVYQSNDAGAIYTSPPDETWSMRGHKIRYNYLHDLHGFEGKGCWGVYLDDCFSSADIAYNIFYDVSWGIFIGGGRDNRITNNLLVDCCLGLAIDARGLNWGKAIAGPATAELKSLNYQQPPWSVKYPELLRLLEDQPLAPKGNVVARNVCFGGKWSVIEGIALPLIRVSDNVMEAHPKLTTTPGEGWPPAPATAAPRAFAGKPPADFRLADDSLAYKLGFQPIPREKIGLYPSPDRASWPVEHPLRSLDRPSPQ